ncbi:MAG: 30S ribosomal protein S6 [bacterium]|nr:30S ribosomal protein S6 [bacterium]
MKNYELTYLITPLFSEEEAVAFQDKMTSFIQGEGGILTEGGILVRRRLAYPIKKQQQAYLASLTFQVNPEKIASLEKKLKAEKEILRYILIIKSPARKMLQRIRRPVSVPGITSGTKEFVPSKEKKVELKEIEKK